MTLTDKTVLITGANRGIGAALVRAFLRQDVGQIFAAARNPSDLPDFGDERVIPLRIDITCRWRRESASKRREISAGSFLPALTLLGRGVSTALATLS